MHVHVFSTLAFLGLATAGGAVLEAHPQSAQRLQVPVAGLDTTRGPMIERTLRELESKDEARKKLLAEVSIDVEKGLVQLVVADGQKLRLEQVERALVANGTRIQRDKLALGEAHLVLEGEADEAALDKLRQALTADLFASAEVRKEGEPARLVAHVRSGHPTHQGRRARRVDHHDQFGCGSLGLEQLGALRRGEARCRRAHAHPRARARSAPDQSQLDSPDHRRHADGQQRGNVSALPARPR